MHVNCWALLVNKLNKLMWVWKESLFSKRSKKKTLFEETPIHPSSECFKIKIKKYFKEYHVTMSTQTWSYHSFFVGELQHGFSDDSDHHCFVIIGLRGLSSFSRLAILLLALNTGSRAGDRNGALLYLLARGPLNGAPPLRTAITWAGLSTAAGINLFNRIAFAGFRGWV